MPAEVIRQCAARLGEPGRRHLQAWDLVKAIDEANGIKSARSIYRRLCVPLSNFTVHASGGTLLRHVRRSGKLARRASRSWNRRSPPRQGTDPVLVSVPGKPNRGVINFG